MAAVLPFPPVRPIAASLDVSVELPLITMQVQLLFGPFNSSEEAGEWLSEVERLHKRIEAEEKEMGDATFNEVGLPTGAFIRSYVGHTDVFDVIPGGRKRGSLLPVSTPEVDARDLHITALETIQDAMNLGFDYIERNKER